MMGDRRIDELMIPVSEAISRHITNEAAATDIYNRAYEAVMIATKQEKEDTANVEQSNPNRPLNPRS